MILAIAAAVFLYAQAVSEERFCADAFGREYYEYARAVPRCNVPCKLLRAVKRSRKQ
jgi:protein-S-isoprenylcysteine O-methyltransferase Ste14